MSPITTRIHIHNGIDKDNSNVMMLFLQPVEPKEDYVYSAWNVLNPSRNSQQQCELATSFAASIASFESPNVNYSDPVALTLGAAALITNKNGLSPAISGISNAAITESEVGLDNQATTPPTDLSVTWYVNGNKVVQTNNTRESTLNPGFMSTFQLKQAVWVMFGQQPQITTTFTAQTFGRALEVPIPNGATDVYIASYTESNGIDTFKPVSAAEFDALTRQGA